MKVSILFKECTNNTVYKILLFNIKTVNEYFSVATMYRGCPYGHYYYRLVWDVFNTIPILMISF